MTIYYCKNDSYFGITLDKKIIINIPKFKVGGRKRRSILYNILGKSSVLVFVSTFRIGYEFFADIKVNNYKNIDLLTKLTHEFTFLNG